MSIFVIIQLVNAIIFFAASLLILNNNHKSPATKNIFGAFTALSLWCFFYFIWQLSADPLLAEIWFRVLMFWAILIPFFFVRFVIYFIDQAIKFKRLFYWLDFLTALLLIGTLLGYITSGARTDFYGISNAPVGGILFIPMIVYFGLTILIALSLLLLNLKKATPEVRKHSKYIIFGGFFAYLASLTNYASFLNIKFPPIGNFALPFFLLFMTYPLISRRLIDLKFALRKSTIYFLSTTLLFVEIFLTKIILEPIFMTYHFWVDFFIIFAAIYSFPKTNKRIYNFANRYFFTSLYNPVKVIENLSTGLNTTLDISKIYKLVDNILIETFHSTAIAILLFHKASGSYHASYSHGFVGNNRHSFRQLRDYFKNNFPKNHPIIVDELRKELKLDQQTAGLFQDLDFYSIKIILPLVIEKTAVGILLLGKKKANDVYNEDDLKVLRTAGEEIAMAIENAKLYKKVEDFNKTLQQQVEKQTKVLKEKNDHLVRLAEMRSEFLDIASHQLRTPVSVIKGVLSMIEEGSIPREKEKQFISGALEKSIKLGEIINDLLRASEMDSEKFVLHNLPTSLDEIISKMKNDKVRNAQIKKIKFSFVLPKEPLPLVVIDERYMEHAIINLINNAIQYTKEGSVTVSITADKTQVTIRVIDTGIGIPKENLPKLFQKFSRATNAIEAYADGSGLGLFIIKQIIDATPGAKIVIEKTELNKGTTFALYLPVAK